MASYDDIVQRVIGNTGRDDKQSVIEGVVTDTLVELQKRGNHYFMEEIATRPIVVNQQDYSLPSDYKDIINVWLLNADGTWTSEKPLDKLNFEEARIQYNANDEGDPEAYSLYRSALYVWPPKPQDNTKKLHLEHYEYQPAITGAQSNELTDRWPELVEAWSTWRFYQKLPNAEKEVKDWRDLALPMYGDLERYSFKYRLKGKSVLKVRTTPRQHRSARRAIPFGGR